MSEAGGERGEIGNEEGEAICCCYPESIDPSCVCHVSASSS